MRESSNSINRRKQSASWSSLNPEERSILTANQLNVQNQKVRKDLEVIHKGIEDEKRCEKVARAKEELMLQNRLNRLSKASERFARRSRASMTSVDATRSFLEKSDSSSSHRGNKSDGNISRTNDLSSKSAIADSRNSPVKTISEQAARRSADKKKVRFGSNNKLRDADELNSRESTTQRSFPDSPRASLLSNEVSRIDSTEEQKPTKMPSCLDYYNAPMAAKISQRPCKGFSQNTASFSNITQRNSLNHLSGLEDEMQRWRRLHYTRAMNARLKAVRLIGRRHTSNLTLREAMDLNARMRKDLAFRSDTFTAEHAWRMLNCRYLRLTPNNVKTLEEMCGDAGYDVTAHPHMVGPNPRTELDSVFKDIRPTKKQASQSAAPQTAQLLK